MEKDTAGGRALNLKYIVTEDELNRQKGEKGKPEFKANKKTKCDQAENGGMERNSQKEWNKGSKVDKIKIDR